MTPEPARLAWTKSSYCGSNACVEVAIADRGEALLVRDSKRPRQAPLNLSRAQWEDFLAGILAVVYRTHRYYFYNLKARRLAEGVA